VPPAPPTAEELVEAGRVAYNANCIACHSLDPKMDGALGPAVSGASRELVAERVLRAAYPEGYEPKRTTRVMVALPHLEPKIDALTAYLESLE
jgi:mono/diheme cytochrome c family protein